MIDQNIQKHLNDIAFLYESAGDGWKANAYRKASEIEEFPVDSEGTLLTKVKGVGDGIALTIKEFILTGTSKTYEKLKKDAPPVELQELTKIPKIGLATAKKIWQDTGVQNLEMFGQNLDLLKAGPYAKFIPGYEKLLVSRERLPRYEVKAVTDRLLKPLLDLGINLRYAGSMRRFKETVRDVDVIVCIKDQTETNVIRDYFEKKDIRPDVRDGSNKLGLTIKVQDQDVTLDLNLCEEGNLGAYMLYLTGSKEFNVEMRSLAKFKGFLLNEYGLFTDTEKKTLVAGKTEEEVFKALDIPFVPPECRDAGALGQDFSDLIKARDLIADFHTHSIYSDGHCNVSQLEDAARKANLTFIGIADHSPGSGNGPSEATKVQQIYWMNDCEETTLVGAEIDIKSNGELEYSADLINKLRYMVLAVHHSVERNLGERYIKALEHYPSVPKIIAHPMGRKIGGVEKPIKIDWDKVFEVCKKTNTVLEINGQIERQDLPPEIIKRALRAGVYVAIGSDAHNEDLVTPLKTGVRVARRGWVKTDMVLNANYKLIDRWLHGILYKN